MVKRIGSLVLILVMIFSFVACADDGATSTPAEITSTAQPQSVPADSSAVEEVVELNQAFLTGLEKDADYPENQRIGAVMVNNISGSRPQRGISEAEVLIEIVVEGGITRFMALYEDYTEMPVVGPVRSARDQFFQLLLPYWGFYVHNAQSGITKTMFDQYEYDEFNLDVNFFQSEGRDPEDYDAIAWRDQDRLNEGYPLEYTQYTSGAHVASVTENNDLSGEHTYGSPIFDFVPYTDPARVPEEGQADEVAIVHSGSYRTYFAYENGEYMMSMYNSSRGEMQPTIDENNNEHVGFENVLVLFAPMRPYPGGTDGLMEVTYDNGGVGYYFSEGGYETIFWEKGPLNQPLLLYKFDARGEEMVKINTGDTYLAMVNDTYLEEFDGILKSGTAAETVADGEANPDEVEVSD